MRRTPGEQLNAIELPALDGSRFTLDSIQNKRYLLSFFRFAGCPLCNLRLHQLVSRYQEFGANFTIVAIFDATLNDLQRHTMKHAAPFPILADHDNRYYRQFGIERSLTGMVTGMVTRAPTLLYAMFGKGYWPTSIGGNVTTLPADFLVDERHIIQEAYYGKDEGDHLDLETVVEFSRNSAPKIVRNVVSS